MKYAKRFNNYNEYDEPIYKVKFWNFAYVCGNDAVDIYRKYDRPCTYEDAWHNLCSACRELDELAILNDGNVEPVYSPENAHIGDETIYVGSWHKDYDDAGLESRTLTFDSTLYDFEEECHDNYYGYATAWIEQVA